MAGALGIRSLLLLSAVVSARLEVLNIQLVMGLFLGNPQRSLSAGLCVSLDALLAMLQCLGTFKCSVIGTANDPG